MAIAFMDGFDHYNDVTELTRKGWSYSFSHVNVWISYGQSPRFAGNGYSVGWFSQDGIVRTVTASRNLPTSEDVVYMGFAFKAGNFNHNRSFQFLDSGSYQCGIRINTDRTISIIRGGPTGTVLGTSIAAVLLGAWHHISFQLTIHDTAGVGKLWVDGQLLLDLSGLDTKQTANASANGVHITSDISPGTTSFYLDDFYVGNDTGSYNTSCPGDRRIHTMFPNGDGANSAWTASAGNDYECVDEVNPDDDTTYISASSVGDKETFLFPDLPAGITAVNALQLTHYSRKDDATTRTLKATIRSGGSDYALGADKYLGSTYSFYPEISEEDPQDNTAWSVADINAAEFGLEVSS